MMAVPFTFRSSTPHVPGEGGSSSFATLHKGGGGEHLQGGGDTLPLFCSLGADTRAGCMQCFRSKPKTSLSLFSFFFSTSKPDVGPRVQRIVTWGNP